MEVDNRNGVSFAEFSLSFVSKQKHYTFIQLVENSLSISLFYIDITIANKLKNRHVGSDKQTRR